jgi:hypothetical protein
MAPTEPGQSESAFIGYAVVTALLDHLTEKNIISEADVTAILGAAVKKLSDGGALRGGRANLNSAISGFSA